MSGMRRTTLAVVAVLALTALVATSAAAPTTTAAQLTTRFKASTGEKLVRNKLMSSGGHYVAYDLGIPNVAKRARWGTFTVFVVTAADAEADVTRLLADTRTGELGTPAAGNIYWEQGATIHGQVYWQAKRRYGTNVVLKWIGNTSAKKTDATWKRLHTALTKATK
jgi:hypothetical protein